ncbi:unnamed protein product, partial [Arabidopsis halleri]
WLLAVNTSGQITYRCCLECCLNSGERFAWNICCSEYLSSQLQNKICKKQ